MNLKLLLLLISLATILCRQIRKGKQQLIHINLEQKGTTVSKILSDNLQNNITIDFQLSKQQKEKIKQQNKKLEHLDHIQQAYQIEYIPLRNYFNAQYFGKVSLGEENEKFSILFDSGSSYTWVAQEGCESCKKAGIKHFYNCEDSDTCQLLKKHTSLEYGTGKAEAQLMIDNISLGDLQIKNQTMLLLSDLTELKRFEGDGLGGLGFDTLSDGYPTLIDNLYSQNLISKKEFSFYIKNIETENFYSNDDLSSSQLIIGGFDQKYMDQNDEWHYCDVINNRYWAVSGNFVGFSSKDGNKIRQLNAVKQVYLSIDKKSDLLFTSLFVIDSGTSVIALYYKDHENLIAYLVDYGINCTDSFQYPGLTECDEVDIDKYPNFQVSLCGKVYTIPPEKYILCGFFKCYLLIQSFDQRVSILGDLFISEYYTHFIQDSPRKIGFVKANK